MPLSSGAKAGPYEILTPLDAGGMGEVVAAASTIIMARQRFTGVQPGLRWMFTPKPLQKKPGIFQVIERIGAGELRQIVLERVNLSDSVLKLSSSPACTSRHSRGYPFLTCF